MSKAQRLLHVDPRLIQLPFQPATADLRRLRLRAGFSSATRVWPINSARVQLSFSVVDGLRQSR